MSNQLKDLLHQDEQPSLKRYCLSKDDWDKLAATLIIAQELFESAEEISESDWKAWTSEFSAEQGFPAIIYHDQPVIVKPPKPPLHKAY